MIEPTGIFMPLLTFQPNYTVETEEGSSKTMIGSLDPDCEVGGVVQQAYDNAKFLCEQVTL